MPRDSSPTNGDDEREATVTKDVEKDDQEVEEKPGLAKKLERRIESQFAKAQAKAAGYSPQQRRGYPSPDLERGEDFTVESTNDSLKAELTRQSKQELMELQAQSSIREQYGANLEPGEDFRLNQTDKESGAWQAEFTEKGRKKLQEEKAKDYESQARSDLENKLENQTNADLDPQEDINVETKEKDGEMVYTGSLSESGKKKVAKRTHLGGVGEGTPAQGITRTLGGIDYEYDRFREQNREAIDEKTPEVVGRYEDVVPITNIDIDSDMGKKGQSRQEAYAKAYEQNDEELADLNEDTIEKARTLRQFLENPSKTLVGEENYEKSGMDEVTGGAPVIFSATGPGGAAKGVSIGAKFLRGGSKVKNIAKIKSAARTIGLGTGALTAAGATSEGTPTAYAEVEIPDNKQVFPESEVPVTSHGEMFQSEVPIPDPQSEKVSDKGIPESGIIIDPTDTGSPADTTRVTIPEEFHPDELTPQEQEEIFGPQASATVGTGTGTDTGPSGPSGPTGPSAPTIGGDTGAGTGSGAGWVFYRDRSGVAHVGREYDESTSLTDAEDKFLAFGETQAPAEVYPLDVDAALEATGDIGKPGLSPKDIAALGLTAEEQFDLDTRINEQGPGDVEVDDVGGKEPGQTTVEEPGSETTGQPEGTEPSRPDGPTRKLGEDFGPSDSKVDWTALEDQGPDKARIEEEAVERTGDAQRREVTFGDPTSLDAKEEAERAEVSKSQGSLPGKDTMRKSLEEGGTKPGYEEPQARLKEGEGTVDVENPEAQLGKGDDIGIKEVDRKMSGLEDEVGTTGIGQGKSGTGPMSQADVESLPATKAPGIAKPTSTGTPNVEAIDVDEPSELDTPDKVKNPAQEAYPNEYSYDLSTKPRKKMDLDLDEVKRVEEEAEKKRKKGRIFENPVVSPEELDDFDPFG